MLGDTVEPPCPLPLEISLEPGVGHVSGWLVDAGHGLGQGLLRDVSGQNPGVPLGCLGPKKLFQVDGERIGLLTTGAARAPDGENPVFLMAAGELRQYHIAEKGKMVGFPHKKGIIRGQLIEYQLQISGSCFLSRWSRKAEKSGYPRSRRNGKDGW